MQDISIIPQWEAATYLKQLQKNPLEQKIMKAKLDKLYAISPYNQIDYVGDTLEAYAWIKLANELEDFSKYFVNEKAQKWFLEEFVSGAIRYMVICRKFKHLVLMVLTQQMIVEGLKLYSKKFDQLDRYPRMSSILKTSLEYDKQFYKLNYINDYQLIFPYPTSDQISKNIEFVNELKPDDYVDFIKIDHHTRRFCWLSGKVQKITHHSVLIQADLDKVTYSLDRKSLYIQPHKSREMSYLWRNSLKQGDYVDYMDNRSIWVRAKIIEKREIQMEEFGKRYQVVIEWQGKDETLPLTDPRIQKQNTFSSDVSIQRASNEGFLDDYNDILVDPEVKSIAVIRSEFNRSILLADFINFTEVDLKLFQRALEAVQTRKFGIQVTADLIGAIAIVHPLLHRKFCLQYLPKMIQAILSYVENADQMTIRNFSKERFQIINTALAEFLKRMKTAGQRKHITEELQLSLAVRFLQSDFLDRKLYAISLLTAMLKQSKHKVLKRSTQDLLNWVREKGILPLIYNEKSHSELISRSSDFLQYFLTSQPTTAELNPLLEWSEPILKIVNDWYQYLPQEFKNILVDKIKQRTNVTNKDALQIIRRTNNCQSWLLSNGGQSWVLVVKEKSKKKDLILQVFKHSFEVVEKITREVAELYECKFKTEYFLQLHEANYLPKILQDDRIPFLKRVQFAAIALQSSLQIKQELFNAISPYIIRMDQLPAEAQQFFISLLPKLQSKHLNQLFKDNFTDEEELKKLGVGQFSFFKAIFFKLNQQQQLINRKTISVYPTPQSYKKEKKQILTIRVNPNELNGMKELMTIVFGNNDLKVTQNALQFIGFLFDRLAPELAANVAQFRSDLLQNCLEKLYASENNQEKYLRIIEGLLDESQKTGIDSEPAVNSLFLNQSLTLRIVDHFNINKSRMLMQVPATLTLYELRAQLARQLNAYPHELKLILGDKQIDLRLSGRVIHTLNLGSADIIAQKKVVVQKIGLCEQDGSLNEKCKNILKIMFKQYSHGGLMSKSQCQKYHQRCVGQVSSFSENKVDKIYDQYDTDKDGYLTYENFLAFYEYSAKIRELTVWNNLQSFGVRNDLEDLRQLQITYPEADKMIRHLLFRNKKFMHLLIKLLQSEHSLAYAAWQIASRLPLLPHEEFFALEVNRSHPFLFRYWLYEIAQSQRWELMTSQVLEKLLDSDIQTTCIGLKAAIHSPQFSVETFSKIINNLKKLNAQHQLSFHSQVVLDNTLKVLQWFLKEDESIQSHFGEKHSQYNSILTTGLMSKNPTVRRMYCQTVETILTDSAAEHIEIFQPIFRLVYTNFEKCDKSTLSIQYFDLYSQLLQVLKQNTTLLPKLDLNWLILTKSMISLFLNHKSTQTGLNSPPDQVAQGYLRILRKLLDPSTVDQLVPLVKFLFQHSLFPESGKNKLKNAKSRRQAYELLYAICSMRDNTNDSPGLQELFNAGFKTVYKKMSSNKSTTASYGFSSYFYNYNQARSQLGYAGLRNLGCICYMIAMLQQLFMTQTFRSLVLMTDDGQPECLTKRGTKEYDDNIFHQLQNMFANLQLTEKQDYNPEQFCFAFKDFEGQSVNVSVQQDAQQFINLFFDKIETALKPTPFRRVLEDIFGGKTCNQTICSNCKAVNERLEPFYPLSLQIKGIKSIEESFKKFINGEVISDYQCDACKKKTDVTKSTFLAKVPNYFIIHLKRMEFNYDKFENEKLNTRWQFPQKLNVYPYTIDNQKGIGESSEYDYVLKGVVLHYGSADFGHYFSYIKQSDNRWIQFNDERVRQFDPHDIQVDCFGGEHWRRQSQNAYLLVYEKVKKHPLHLEFESQEEKTTTINKYNLQDSLIINKQQQLQNDEIPQVKLQEKELEEGEQQVKKQEEKKKVIAQITCDQVPSYVPEHLREKISKANEQFSFTLNLSNDEFAHFLHKILSIDPPSSLSTEYLELCYECFPLRTVVDDQQNITLSEWAIKRFRQIIGGHGWQFLKSFGQNWQNDILSIERSTRIGIKNLLQCVISDIIRTAKDEEDSTQKDNLVRNFLHKYTQMMGGQVTKHWNRFREYFQVWIFLIGDSQIVKKWCENVKMVERLLDFMLQQYSPFSKDTNKKYHLRNLSHGAQFEHPLQALSILLKEGYALSEAERDCMRHYAFLEKLIKYPSENFNIIDYICKDDRNLSQKFAYLALVQTSKVNQSDDVKPIIFAMQKFLEIKDDYGQLRVDWLIGFPQYSQNVKTLSYGVYNINPENQTIINFVSPVRALPIPQQLVRFKNKAQHVASLLLTFLLQLQSDGFINNLDSFPSLFAFNHPYTHWFKQFIETYYEQMHRSFIARHYTEYGNRLMALWENRPNRSFPSYPNYLVGRTIDRKKSKKTESNQMLEVETYDIESKLLQLNEENAFLNKKNIKNFSGSDDFRVKQQSSSYIGGGFLNMDRSNHSSEEEQLNDKKPNNPFDKAFNGVLLRKIAIKNTTYENLLLVARIKSPTPEPNYSPSNIEVSFDVKGGSAFILTLHKHRIEEPFGEYTLEIQTLGQSTREGYWPRQIISAVSETAQEEEGSEESDQGSSSPTWVI